jgi:WD40 repeat protein
MPRKRWAAVLIGLALVGSVPLASAGPVTVRWPRPSTACQEASGAFPASFGPAVPLDMGGHSDLRSVAVGSMDGRPVVISAGVERTIRTWDAATLRPLSAPIPGAGPAAYAEVGGRPVVVGAGETGLLMWDLATGEQVGPGMPMDSIRDLVVGELDGRPIAAAGGRYGARVFDLATGRRLSAPATDAVDSVALTRVRGALLLLTGARDMAYAWDPRTGKPVGRPLQIIPEHVQTFSAMEPAVIGGRPVALIPTQDLGVLRWDLITRTVTENAIEGRFDVAAVTSLNGRSVLVAREHPADAPRDSQGHHLIRLAGRPVAVTFGERRARLWDVGTGKRMASFRFGGRWQRSANAEIAQLDCTTVAVVPAGSTVRVYDLATGRQIEEPLMTDPSAPVSAHAVGRLSGVPVAVTHTAQRMLRVWDLTDSSQIGTIPLPSESLHSLTIDHHDGRTILIGGGDEEMWTWDLGPSARSEQ